MRTLFGVRPTKTVMLGCAAFPVLLICIYVYILIDSREGEDIIPVKGGWGRDLDCNAGPRKTFPSDGTPVASLVLSPLIPHEAGNFGPLVLSIDQLPRGEIADAFAVAAIETTLDRLRACSQPENTEKLFALYSDDYFRRPSSKEHGRISYWRPPSEAGDVGGLDVENARRLPDGRLGAVILGNGIAPVFVVFVSMGDDLLIDEWISIEDEREIGTPDPSAVPASSPATSI
jgi:hypothetical protein